MVALFKELSYLTKNLLTLVIISYSYSIVIKMAFSGGISMA